MIRIALTVPKELLNEFDYTLKKNGYTSRRKGLVDVMEKYIDKNK